MAWSQSDLDAIEKAIASGARVVQFQDHRVEYQSTSQMLKARDAIRGDLDESTRPGVSFAEYHDGA